MADVLGMRPRLILNTLNSFMDMLQDRLSDYHRLFFEKNGEDPVLERIDQAILKRIRRTRSLVAG
jgi:hypothetical protein